MTPIALLIAATCQVCQERGVKLPNEAMSQFNDPHIIRVSEVFAELVLSTRSVEVTHLPSDDTEGGSHD